MSKEDTSKMRGLSRQQLKELEAKEKTKLQKLLDWIVILLPIVCGMVAIFEYKFVPDGTRNKNPNTYLGALILFIAAYIIYFLIAVGKKSRGSVPFYEKLRYRAPLFSALFLLLSGYDYLTLKTGILTQPFIPCMNSILNIAWEDRSNNI